MGVVTLLLQLLCRAHIVRIPIGLGVHDAVAPWRPAAFAAGDLNTRSMTDDRVLPLPDCAEKRAIAIGCP